MRAKITTALVLALSAALATGAAWAHDDDDDRRWKHRHHHVQHHKHHKKHHKHHKHEHVVHHVYHHQGPARARVERVVPVVTHVTVPSSREECWSEPVVVRHPGSGSYTPMIVGGIIGGVVGNQVGKGTGKDVATVAGAALGASVGRDIYGGPRGGGSTVHHEQRCRTVDTSYTEERVDGYRVRYRYQGDSHWARMDHDPGDWVRVGVDVRPGRH